MGIVCQEKECINNLTVIHSTNLPVSKLKFMVKHKPVQQAVKRFMDIILSLTAIILSSPLFLLLIIIIKLDSKGPAIFKQERVGFREKIFYMYKFRSMVEDAEEQFEKVKDLNHTNPVMFKSKKDPRITKIGKIIRKCSLDELPQLFNILKGEMSLVRPRPPLPRELLKYEEHHMVKFLKPPGLTGLWQISGRANIKDFDKVIELDYEYIRTWNILLDLKIIFKTIFVVISAKGAG
ncbi:MAG: sugar transferase [Candidatus Gastranaerophilales bacterium]|nr:sugar transferase [Candidatus Gastranaerophilales bacterium]